MAKFSIDSLLNGGDGKEENGPVAKDGYTGPFSPYSGQGTVVDTYQSHGVTLVDVTFQGEDGVWTFEG